MLEFEWPWLFCLLPLPWLLRRLAAPANGGQAALRVPFIDDMAAAEAPGATATPRRFALAAAALAWAALLSAAANPRWVGSPIELPITGRDIMLAVDLSGSMRKRDFVLQGRRVDRLTATKAVAGDFIRRRQGDRVGLILFGSQAYLQAPLTFDRRTVVTLLDEAVIGMAGEKTAIGDAIGLGIKRLQSKTGDRLLILLSDGTNTAGQIGPLKAADLAARDEMKIYTIGIGRAIDENALTQTAQKTGGRYFYAADTRALEGIYRLIDKLEPVESDQRVYRPVAALFYWPLAVALLLACVLALGLALPGGAGVAR